MTERPLKRHGSDSSQTSSSPKSFGSLSPQFSESVASSTYTVVSSSDDEKPQDKPVPVNSKTYTISTGEVKVGECSRYLTDNSNQRDSQTNLYSSSSKCSVKASVVEEVSSPVES